MGSYYRINTVAALIQPNTTGKNVTLSQPPAKVEWGALPCPLTRLLYHRPAQAMVQEAEQGSRTPLTSPLLPQAR